MKNTTPTMAQWFVYQDEQISGPIGIDDILKAEATDRAGKDVYVCRTDFKKWYPLRDLTHLLHAQRAFNQESAQEQASFQKEFETHLQSLRHIGQRFAGQEYQVFATPEPDTSTTTTTEAPKLAQPIIGRIEQRYYHYYLLKNRLRLGQLRHALICALWWPLTLGWYWVTWMKTCYREITWHNQATYAAAPKSLNWSWIPILHFWFLWRLVQVIYQAEPTAKKRCINRFVAMICGMIPPLAICYVQWSLNRHWRQHVRDFNTAKAALTSLHKSH